MREKIVSFIEEFTMFAQAEAGRQAQKPFAWYDIKLEKAHNFGEDDKIDVYLRVGTYTEKKCY